MEPSTGSVGPDIVLVSGTDALERVAQRWVMNAGLLRRVRGGRDGLRVQEAVMLVNRVENLLISGRIVERFGVQTREDMEVRIDKVWPKNGDRYVRECLVGWRLDIDFAMLMVRMSERRRERFSLEQSRGYMASRAVPLFLTPGFVRGYVLHHLGAHMEEQVFGVLTGSGGPDWMEFLDLCGIELLDPEEDFEFQE